MSDTLQNHPRPHEDHAHDEHGHTHNRPGGALSWLKGLFGGRSHGRHSHTAAMDVALSNERGIWALKVSLAGLLATSIFQLGVVLISGSVALLADTVHNFSDALTALPLWLAFALAKRARTRRYTYGYGRAEDLAGAFIVLMILASAVMVFYESIVKIVSPEPLSNLGWVAAAAVTGFVGNELVAWFRIKVGREINSAALIADGVHARADGFTSLGVLAGAIGVWLGFPLADPLAGIGIGIAILAIVWSTAREMWYRLMDATDPAVYDMIEKVAAAVPGVLDVHDVAVRWVGHRQRGELHITVDGQIPTMEGHRIAEQVRLALRDALPALEEMTVHVDPDRQDTQLDHHAAHHRSHEF